MTRLPYTARDTLKLSPLETVLFDGTIALCRLLGRWRAPVPASGDIETMTVRDKIYWVYKAQYPIERAVPGSGLEAYFAAQPKHEDALPSDFQPETRATLSAVGDLMDHPYLAASKRRLYDAVADAIFGVDLPMANLECVIVPGSSPAFVVRPTASPVLAYDHARFDAAKGADDGRYGFLCTANNHSLDFGAEGVRSTLDALDEAGIATHGMNRAAADAVRPCVLTRNGIRIGLLAHTFGLNAKKPPPDAPWIVNRTYLNGSAPNDVRQPTRRRRRLTPADNPVDFGLFEAQLAACRDARVDLVIGHLHWGMEHELYPRPEQLGVAHHLAELGVDVVIGHHPHVVQPLELYRTQRDPDRLVPIFYSLGNLVNPFRHPTFRRGGLAELRVARGRVPSGAVRTYVESARLREVFQHVDDDHERLRLELTPNL